MIDRRSVLAGTGALALAARARADDRLRIVATGIGFPEGPLAAPNGDVVLCDLRAGRILRVTPQGGLVTLAHIEGQPAGLAVGPDGAIYVANIGKATPAGDIRVRGSVQRLDPASRTVSLVVAEVDGKPLRGPDDLVFDAAGGFYFTDTGVFAAERPSMDLTSVYYFDGKAARRLTTPGSPTNGVGLSPDGRRLYWTEYFTGRLYARDVIAPGVLAEPTRRNGDCLYVHGAPVTYFDSLRVDAEGHVSVAVHDGTLTGKSGIMTFDPEGRPMDFVAMPDASTTNLAISPSGQRQAWITLGVSGRLAVLPWPRYGQKSRLEMSAAYLT